MCQALVGPLTLGGCSRRVVAAMHCMFGELCLCFCVAGLRHCDALGVVNLVLPPKRCPDTRVSVSHEVITVPERTICVTVRM
jgi:hypothetical protein